MMRRTLLLSSFALPTLSRVGVASGKKKFWDVKEPSEWSNQEIEQLISRSPWARETTADVNMQDRGDVPASTQGGSMPGRGAGSGGGMPGGGMPGGGMGGPGGLGGGEPGMDSAPRIKATVRWESARAITDAEKRQPLEDAAKYYIISVTELNFPATRPNATIGPQNGGDNEDSDRRATMADRMTKQTYLQLKGREPIYPERVDHTQGSGTIAFFFSRGGMAVTQDDREILFVTRTGPATIKAKFSIKDMMYRGRLDL